MLAAGAVALAAAVPALASSDGVYDHDRQGCTLESYTYDKRNQAEPGCQGFTIQVGPRESPDFVRIGFYQTPEGVGPHAGSIKVGEGGDSQDDDSNRIVVVSFDSGYAVVGPRTLTPSESEPPGVEQVSEPGVTPVVRPGAAEPPKKPLDWTLYFWMDDNFTVFGEHHSINVAKDPARDTPVAQGPVSGGGIRADTHPDTKRPERNVNPTNRRRPLRAAEGRAGFCADGWCMTIQTQERTVYRGGGDGEHAAYDYREGLDPGTCDFRDPGPNCRDDYESEGRVYAPAGLTIYQDPDPQAPCGFREAEPVVGCPIAPTHVGADGVLVAGHWVLDLRA